MAQASRIDAIEQRNADASRGLVIYRASRLEALLEPLLDLLDAAPPADPLSPQTVLAAHPGMRHWLARELARARGPRGIVANLDVLLPSSYIDRLALQHAGAQAVALPGWRRPQLRWTLFELLQAPPTAVSRERLDHYLGAGDAGARARRRFQLADRLARLYSQYLVYRPDWLHRFERGQAALSRRDTPRAALEAELIAPLWRALKGRLGEHRADVLQRLPALLRRLPPAPPLHVFGLNHSPPQELAVLAALAQRQLVALYVPDPCREYWGGLGREAAEVRPQRAAEQQALEHAGEHDYFLEHRVCDADGIEHSHPLLARCGRLGQQFFMALADVEGVREDVRHWRDREDPAPANRLQRLQESLRRLAPSLLRVDLSDPQQAAAERADDSLRVHACHTRLRELETLHEVLLAATGAAPGSGEARFAPGQIVVMAPDIGAYAPLIPAVFGAAGDTRARLPYHLADVSTARSHRLFAAVRRLLALPAARLSPPELVDLLQVPEIARRFGLDAQRLESDDIEGVIEWLRQSRAGGGLDAEFRLRFGLPPLHAHSFAWALDRLLAGYLIEDASGSEGLRGLRLADGSELAPLGGVHGAAADQVGALDALLQALQGLFDLADQTLPLGRWMQRFETLFDSFFRLDPQDPGAREADSALRQLLAALAAEPAGVAADPLLPFALVRDLLLEKLDAVPERQPFLLGGITFCGMVPQRAIPFGLVAALGLNEGEFPRRAVDGGLDLMVQQPRLYDREQRSDDRYLFLETLMSARGQLHLSYVGASAKDGSPRNPAAPLAELLALLDVAAGIAPEQGEAERPWCVAQPLQPFDARLFDGGDQRLFSHRAAFAALPNSSGLGALPAFADDLDLDGNGDADGGLDGDLDGDGASPAARPAVQPPAELELHALRGFWRDPAQQVLAQGLQLRLDALDAERLPDSEPLQARVDAREQLSQRLLFEHLRYGLDVAAPTAPPAWLRLSGLLPPGRLGASAWRDERLKLDAMLEGLRARTGFTAGAPQSQRIELRIGDTRLRGEVDGLIARADGGHWLLRAFPKAAISADASALKSEDDLDFSRRLPLFLDWACLRLFSSQATPAPLRLLALLDADSPSPWIDGINAFDAALCAADVHARAPLLATLSERLQQLLALWCEGQRGALPYLPRSSWAAYRVEREPDKGTGTFSQRLAAAVHSAWRGGHQRGEIDYGPGYARLLFAALNLGEDSPQLLRLRALSEHLQQCISLQPPMSGSGQTREPPSMSGSGQTSKPPPMSGSGQARKPPPMSGIGKTRKPPR